MEAKIPPKPNPFSGRGWIRQGISFGLFMFVFNMALDYFFYDENPSVGIALKSLPIWLAGGLVYGYVVKLVTPTDQSKGE
ncbi:MAG: hypothetical protein Kow0027_16470 [Saprospiraceae bacterium]